MSFKSVLIWSSGSPSVQWSGTNYAILKEGIMGNIHLSCMKFGSVVQEEMSFKEKVYGRRKTDDGRTTDAERRVITIPHIELSAQVS